MSDRAHSKWLLLALVMASIVLQLINASLIKYASTQMQAQYAWLAFLLAVVIALSFGRFMLWGAMHKRFPVSLAYPATALFFPCLVVLAWVYGETVSTAQMLGAALVTSGVLVLLSPARTRAAAGDGAAP
jgi:drug/metabolite transporter (DMT)-like permease